MDMYSTHPGFWVHIFGVLGSRPILEPPKNRLWVVPLVLHLTRVLRPFKRSAIPNFFVETKAAPK